MNSSRYSPAQVICTLMQAPGTPVPRFYRKKGIAKRTFYRWKRRCAGMVVAEVRKLRLLEKENRKLKQLVAELTGQADATRCA